MQPHYGCPIALHIERSLYMRPHRTVSSINNSTRLSERVVAPLSTTPPRLDHDTRTSRYYPPRSKPKPTHTGRRSPGAMEDVNRRARKEAIIHSRRHMCLPYARDTLGGSRHDSRNGSESENVLKHGDLLYFLPGLAFVPSAALPAAALPAGAPAAFFCRSASPATRGSVRSPR